MLGQPTLVFGNFGSDTEGQTLFAEQSVAAVAAAVRPD